MIVKVQLSRFSTSGKRQVLVYDASGRWQYEGVATPEVIRYMRGQDRAFFEAEVDASGRFSLGVEVTEEMWTAAALGGPVGLVATCGRKRHKRRARARGRL